MAGLRFFLPALFVVSACGQSPQNAVDPMRIAQKAARAILSASFGQAGPVVHTERFSAATIETSCSVPLIEMKVSKDINFTMAQVPPPEGFSDNMPVAHGLPACPPGTGR
jgi:hypothetical protein